MDERLLTGGDRRTAQLESAAHFLVLTTAEAEAATLGALFAARNL
jgi:hypothetical protein